MKIENSKWIVGSTYGEGSSLIESEGTVTPVSWNIFYSDIGIDFLKGGKILDAKKINVEGIKNTNKPIFTLSSEQSKINDSVFYFISFTLFFFIFAFFFFIRILV
jgi:hypothetical protein